MFDLNDVEPINSGELLPDGSFAKVTMVIRPGGVDGLTDIDKGLLKASNAPGSDVCQRRSKFPEKCRAKNPWLAGIGDQPAC